MKKTKNTTINKLGMYYYIPYLLRLQLGKGKNKRKVSWPFPQAGSTSNDQIKNDQIRIEDMESIK